jgi:hypothetical protein
MKAECPSKTYQRQGGNACAEHESPEQGQPCWRRTAQVAGVSSGLRAVLMLGVTVAHFNLRTCQREGIKMRHERRSSALA